MDTALDDLEWVTRRRDSPNAEWATFVFCARAEMVGRAVEGVEMKEGEENHFYAEKQIRQHKRNIIVRHRIRRFQRIRRMQNSEDDILDEAEKDDAFNAEKLDECAVGGERGFKAAVEVYDVECGNGDRDGADDFELGGGVSLRSAI